VQYFHGPLEGVVDDQLGGSVSIAPPVDLRLGPLSAHLKALSDRVSAVDLGWSSASLKAPTLIVAWAFKTLSNTASDRQGARALRVSLTGMHAEAATATGLRLATQLAGAPFAVTMEAEGQATIFGLDIPAMDLLIAEDFITAEGQITGDALVANGLVAKLGPLLELTLDAHSKQLRFDALSDGSETFRLDDLTMEGEVVVRRAQGRDLDPSGQPMVPGEAVMLKEHQPLRTWFIHMEGDASGGLDRSGIDLELKRPLGGRDLDPERATHGAWGGRRAQRASSIASGRCRR